MDPYRIIQGDCLDVMPRLAAEGQLFDAMVTDPPYGLRFMGREWDHGVPGVPFWAEAFKLLKPGAYLVAFGGTRTVHRMTCAIEDAGFEIRDCVMWVYGCLDEQTEVATADGVKPYHETKSGDLVICYDPGTGSYSYQPILEVVEYEYSDTAYRLIGDFGEQVVSRNHRCIIERDGKEVFVFAEDAASEREARVPILESLQEMQKALSDTYPGACPAQEYVRPGVCESYRMSGSSCRTETPGTTERGLSPLHGMPEADVALRLPCEAGDEDNVQLRMQRGSPRGGLGQAWSQGACGVVGEVQGRSGSPDDRGDKPSMAGGPHVSEPQGSLRGAADQICALPDPVHIDGAEGWLCHGTSLDRSPSHWSLALAGGGSASCEPQGNGQSARELDVVRDERAAQGVRAWPGHKTVVVRIVPFHYTGKVWCLRVPTGAFVAVRDGVAFPTGNSGFPKSLDVSKAIDKMMGAEREVIGASSHHVSGKPNQRTAGLSGSATFAETIGMGSVVTAPTTPEAVKWAGFGTALKPAYEPIIVARKPLIGTVAQNVLTHGVGALNIDASRVRTDENLNGGTYSGMPARETSEGWRMANAQRDFVPPSGRWPANVCHDGSDEVMEAFAVSGDARSSGGGGNRRDGDSLFGTGRDGGCSQQYFDKGSAARFFQTCKPTESESLISRAKAIFEGWNPVLASTADNASHLSSEVAVSAVSDAVTWASHGASAAIQIGSFLAHSTSVTPTELRRICEAAIMAILIIESGCSPEVLHEKPIHNGCHVELAETHGQTGIIKITISRWTSNGSAEPATFSITPKSLARGEAGLAANRFHYSAKANKQDRAGSKHPTVKPQALMSWLCKLACPPGGSIIDPFVGSGSTLQAAVQCGFTATGIEAEAEYIADIERRMAAMDLPKP